MSNFWSKVCKVTLFFIVAILLISLLKVFLGGDVTLISVKNLGVALLIIVPSSFLLSIGVVMYDESTTKKD